MKARVLDAAEALLADRGYYGVTMREVCARARTRLGTVTHHFSSKEILFRRVINRRAEEFIRCMDASIATAIADAGGRPSTEELLRAYLAPALTLSARGEGWKNYMRMLAGALNNRQEESFLAPVLERFDPLARRIVDKFIEGHPNVPPEKLYWAFYLVEGSLIYVLGEAGLVDRQSGGLCKSADMTQIFEEMVPLFAAGFARLGSSRSSRADRGLKIRQRSPRRAKPPSR